MILTIPASLRLWALCREPVADKITVVHTHIWRWQTLRCLTRLECASAHPEEWGIALPHATRVSKCNKWWVLAPHLLLFSGSMSIKFFVNHLKIITRHSLARFSSDVLCAFLHVKWDCQCTNFVWMNMILTIPASLRLWALCRVPVADKITVVHTHIWC